jgi:hypothetical protein
MYVREKPVDKKKKSNIFIVINSIVIETKVISYKQQFLCNM